MDKETLMKKVQALLRLAENNANVNEAASAFGKAQRLIHDHNLSMAELESSSESEEDIGFGEDMYERTGKLASWKPSLANVIGMANSCYVYKSKEYKVINGRRKNFARIKIVGRESDVKIANYMFLVMSREVERLCKIADRPPMSRGEGRNWANNFKHGAVSAINKQFEAEKKSAMNNVSTAAIVKVEQRYQDAKDWTNNQVTLVKTKSYRQRNADAFSKGYQAGKQIHARSGLSGTASGQKLLK